MIFNYVRVSTVSQNTERQLKDVSCDREFIEHASGKNTDRRQLQLLLAMLREGDHINIHELSRLARNTQDLLSIVNGVVTRNASIQFHKENLTFNSSKKGDPFQQLMLTMLGAISTFERDLLLERQKEGIAIAKSKGKYKGRSSRFTHCDIENIKVRFSKSKNKSTLAKEIGVSRSYLYQLIT